MAAVLVGVHLLADPLTVEFWAVSRDAVADAGWFRLFSAVLRHADLVHLLSNVAGLVLLGLLLEPRLGAAGVVALVAAAGVGGTLSSAAVNDGASIGASGGVYGLLGAWLVLGGRAPGRRFARPRMPARLWLFLGLLLVLENVRPRLPWSAAPVAGPGIDWAAHLGGAVTGAVIGCAIRATTNAWSTRSPRWVRPAALTLIGLYAVALGWGALLFQGGGPAALAALSDGPAKWIAINNRAWEAALSPHSEPEELVQWREQMHAVVAQIQQPEFVDTLATLQHRLGEHRLAAALERDVSWLHETPAFVEQFARFAWFALREAPPPRGADVIPVREGDEPPVVELSLSRLRIPESGLELDILCWIEDRPFALLRMTLGVDAPARVKLPLDVSSQADAALPRRPLRCAVVHAEAADDERPKRGIAARAWRLDGDRLKAPWEARR